MISVHLGLDNLTMNLNEFGICRFVGTQGVKTRARTQRRGNPVDEPRKDLKKTVQTRKTNAAGDSNLTYNQTLCKKRLYHSGSSTLSGLQILRQIRRVCFSVSSTSMVSRLSEPTITTALLRVDDRTAVPSRRVGHCNHGGDGKEKGA